MIDKKRILAIIPARSGSKGLKNKNLRKIGGKPLIVWTIQEAKKSEYIDKIVVSSDDIEIIKIARKYGAEVPFIRPKELASDIAKIVDVISHTINYYKEEFDIIILLQPTSPLRTGQDIDEAFNILIKNSAKAVVSVCELEHSFHWIGKLPGNLDMKGFMKDSNKNKNRQELDIYYRLNGAIYISDINYFQENNGFFGVQTKAYIMDNNKSIDIDSIIDFKLAEILIKERKNKRF